MKIRLLLVITLVMMCGCTMDKSSPLDVYTDLGMRPIQAHRGGGFALPENTIETFLTTWEMGIIPEADIRTTSDDVIICMHDKTAIRLAPETSDSLINVSFEDMTLEVAQTLDVGSFRGEQVQRIPTLEAVFKIMQGHPERLIYLDYKRIDMDRLASMVHEFGLERQIIFTTKHHHLIREWHDKIPESLSLIWIGGSQENIDKTFDSLREHDYKGVTTLQIHVKYPDEGSDLPYKPSPDYLKDRMVEVSERGILFQVLPWRMVEPEYYTQLMEIGIRSFATDYPEMTIELYDSFLEKHKK